jgi:hypothetical protein
VLYTIWGQKPIFLNRFFSKSGCNRRGTSRKKIKNIFINYFRAFAAVCVLESNTIGFFEKKEIFITLQKINNLLYFYGAMLEIFSKFSAKTR